MGKKQRKLTKSQKKDEELKEMLIFLEKKYKREIKYSCFECLKTTYNSEKNNFNGYVTDEELIESSNYKLRHK
jgi:hypothetical protein